TRFIAAPFLKYFSNNLWREIADHENSMALRLREGLEKVGVEISQPTQANGVFCYFPREIIKELKKKFFFYVWDENTFEVRLMTSFDTTKEDVDAFIQEVDTLINQ
ncbi:MAG: threonine aldolase, partial [Bdellovibrionales bacterium]|nr:threonine aldolase [Bdellovibrionales bacterium]NQZ18359.1 threonine aldolase [Bdellovibrionales bacterium]